MQCVVCSKELSGKRKKFCSQKCYDLVEFAKQKKRYREYNPYLPDRKCVWCNKIFRPFRENHVCCNRECRNQLELLRSKERRRQDAPHMGRWGTNGWVIWPKPYEPKLTDEPMSLKNSKHKNEIEDYLANGGKIKSLPEQIDGRTPDVNVTNLSGWSIETLIGFGYEIRLMEELSSTSEVD